MALLRLCQHLLAWLVKERDTFKDAYDQWRVAADDAVRSRDAAQSEALALRSEVSTLHVALSTRHAAPGSYPG